MRLAEVAALLCIVALGPAASVVIQGEAEEAEGNQGHDDYDQDQGRDDHGPNQGRDDGGRGGRNTQGILERFDPLLIPDQHFDLQLKEVTVQGSTSGLSISGLSGLKLEKLSLGLAEGRVSVDINLPNMSAVGQYNVTGSIGQGDLELPLEGEGQLTAGFTGLRLQTTIELGINDKGQILLDDFQLEWNMTDIRLQLDGLFGGQALGGIVNGLLADTLPHLVLKVYRTKITNAIITWVQTQGAAILLDLHQDHGKPDPEPHRWQTSVFRGEDKKKAPVHVGDLADIEHLLFKSLAEQDANDKREAAAPAALTLGHILAALHGQDGVDKAPPSAVDSGVLRIETSGAPRFYPHGSLRSGTASEADAVDGSVHLNGDNVSHLLSLVSLLSADSGVVTSVQPSGERRFFPHGSLSADEGADSSPGRHPLSLLGDLFSVDSGALLTVAPKGEPRYFPHGHLDVPVEDAPEQKQDLLGDAFRISVSGETKFYPAGTLSQGGE